MANPVFTKEGKAANIGTASLWVTEHGEVGVLPITEHGEFAFTSTGALPAVGTLLKVALSRRRRRG